MLQRIYGIAFYSRKDLGEYLDRLEEAKKRDHRKLGKELDLFHVDEEIGSGLILWHPKGALVRTIIEDFWRKEHYKNGYQILYSPHIARAHLWETSEHLNFYKENMYSPMDIDGTDYIVKPMNCPFHIKIYNSRLRSYRELPFRWAELGTVYRYEKTGVLHGLLRVRGFTQDDAHIFCRSDQLPEEISKALDFTIFILRSFGFEEYQIYLSTKPDKFVGSEESWEKAMTRKFATDTSREPPGMALSVFTLSFCIIGSITAPVTNFTMASTTFENAPPTTTATARSTTLPRLMKLLKSLTTFATLRRDAI